MANQKPIKKQFKHGKEAGFGLFTFDVDITDEKIEQAIAESALESIEQSILSPNNNDFYAYVDAPKQQENIIEDSFGIIKTNRKITLEDMQHAIETMGGTVDNY